MDEHGEVKRTPAAQVGDDLRTAFMALNDASLPSEQRAALHRRLLAITTTSKRDVRRAQEQLVRFFDDLRDVAATNAAQEDE